MYLTDEQKTRFWECVSILEKDACWPWKLSLFKNGYGQTSFNSKKYYAHRVAFSLARGELVKGKYVCHRCDTPACCNPHHLFQGTPTENIVDSVSKGRWNRPKGSHHPNSLLTEESVREIRQEANRLSKNWANELAAKYGVSRRTIYGILNLERWKHI